MRFETNKEKGNSGLGLAIGYYATHNYIVSIPLNDTQDYDLIVDDGNRLLKVQVKATSQRAPSGYTIVTLRSCGGTKGKEYKTVVDTNIDILFVVTELQEMYEVPFEEIHNHATLTFTPERQCWRVDNLPNVYEKKEAPIQENSFEEAMMLRRKVERPERLILAEKIVNSSFVAVGKEYNVSDNAIRKWCKNYDMPTTKKELKEWLSNQLDQ